MNNKKEKAVIYVTPEGTLVFGHLIKPDTQFNPDGDYLAIMRFSSEAAEELIEKIEAVYETNYENIKKQKKGKRIKKAELPFREEVDQDTDEPTGNLLFTFKQRAGGINKDGERWSRKIPIFDAKGKPIKTTDLNIWSGSTLKIAFEISGYFVASIGAGVSLRLKAVQILNLVEGGSADAEFFGFTEEEGFSIEEDEAGFTNYEDEDEESITDDEPEDEEVDEEVDSADF